MRLAIGAPICQHRQMASDRKTVAFIVDQLAAAGEVSAKPMFGEYGLYCDGKMVGLICDDQLFVKPTAGGRAFAGAIDEAPPYPGAKPCLLVDADRWDDAEWLADLVRISTAELPVPKPKKAKATKV
ncbi:MULTISPECIES: TfoX/Sxy family protein [Sphingomonas]|uniref:TfoX/Sxy family protein n=1 Tax=Sphingomonas TaxID=13687 RepID=UPI0010D87CEE|nr:MULTISPECIES: TfoX/Sxy family protein [Sphingomonas]TCQ04429.1 TfoX/Sxy family transcriptional regulator of competence genes [Sphingomonas sp. PP-CC-3A-396]